MIYEILINEKDKQVIQHASLSLAEMSTRYYFWEFLKKENLKEPYLEKKVEKIWEEWGWPHTKPETINGKKALHLISANLPELTSDNTKNIHGAIIFLERISKRTSFIPFSWQPNKELATIGLAKSIWKPSHKTKTWQESDLFIISIMLLIVSTPAWTALSLIMTAINNATLGLGEAQIPLCIYFFIIPLFFHKALKSSTLYEVDERIGNIFTSLLGMDIWLPTILSDKEKHQTAAMCAIIAPITWATIIVALSNNDNHTAAIALSLRLIGLITLTNINFSFSLKIPLSGGTEERFSKILYDIEQLNASPKQTVTQDKR